MVTSQVRKLALQVRVLVHHVGPQRLDEMIGHPTVEITMTAVAALGENEIIAATPVTVILEFMLRALLRPIDEDFPLITDKLRCYLSQHLAAVELGPDAVTELSQWLSGLRLHLKHPCIEAQKRPAAGRLCRRLRIPWPEENRSSARAGGEYGAAPAASIGLRRAACFESKLQDERSVTPGRIDDALVSPTTLHPDILSCGSVDWKWLCRAEHA